MTHKETFSASKNAGFLARLLAELVDFLLFILIFSIIISALSNSQTLAQLAYNVLLAFIIVIFPLWVIGVLYRPTFTHYFGGNLGKLLTGLQVTNHQGQLLTFKQALFRYTIGYTFSGVLFGLGFLTIITDPEKRAFHDKAIGSKVIVTRTLWPLGLIALIALLVANFIIWGNTFQKLNQSPLKSEFGFLMMNLDQQIKQSESKKLNEATPSANFFSPNPIPKPSALNFEPQLKEIYSLLDAKNYTLAQSKAEELEKMAQDSNVKSQANIALADIAYAQSNFFQAQNYALKALALSPNNANAYQILAEVGIAQKDYNLALNYAQSALKIDPNDAISHNDLGVALYGLGRVEEGIAEVKKAIELNPNNQTFQENLKRMQAH